MKLERLSAETVRVKVKREAKLISFSIPGSRLYHLIGFNKLHKMPVPAPVQSGAIIIPLKWSQIGHILIKNEEKI